MERKKRKGMEVWTDQRNVSGPVRGRIRDRRQTRKEEQPFIFMSTHRSGQTSPGKQSSERTHTFSLGEVSTHRSPPPAVSHCHRVDVRTDVWGTNLRWAEPEKQVHR
ncbi:hypothetical protein JOB18_027129 [Solea senegalensis]|uniref:Uncharacterized protein n=1 Tax=Solea senegalensis TaxID=28829 RepID=A0AAV6PU87_SOLSE|nr:hypothetical protein JOB18_027129 [Solea senegalensis]